jgi:hypothetical protein
VASSKDSSTILYFIQNDIGWQANSILVHKGLQFASVGSTFNLYSPICFRVSLLMYSDLVESSVTDQVTAVISKQWSPAVSVSKRSDTSLFLDSASYNLLNFRNIAWIEDRLWCGLKSMCPIYKVIIYRLNKSDLYTFFIESLPLLCQERQKFVVQLAYKMLHGCHRDDDL